MSHYVQHPYHLVDESPWPLLSSLGALFITTGLVKWFHTYSSSLFLIGTFIIMLIIFQWWRDVRFEGTFQGLHASIVELGLRWGITLFIISEVFFFVSFFLSFLSQKIGPFSRNWVNLTSSGNSMFQSLSSTPSEYSYSSFFWCDSHASPSCHDPKFSLLLSSRFKCNSNFRSIIYVFASSWICRSFFFHCR